MMKSGVIRLGIKSYSETVRGKTKREAESVCKFFFYLEKAYERVNGNSMAGTENVRCGWQTLKQYYEYIY